jgi:polyhydroxybutyrate depolymerase
MIGEVATSCRPTRGVSALFIQGIEDSFFPWGGDANQDLISAEDTVDRWVFVNECSGDAQITALPDVEDDGTTVERWDYNGCKDAAEVIFYVVTGGGHTWPGSRQQFPEPVVGRTSRDFVASELIVEFLARQ